ncbi:MAG: DUF3570 domain-containing protein [Gammaproteobacteria bacterium]|nr:DUF3570 domain-containing protein [Gammaproteobacteria bacterium]
MSRKNSKSVTATLTTATCALLGTTATTPVNAQEEDTWEFDTALLYYAEDNDRVQDISFKMLAYRNFVDDRVLSMSLGVDSLTGATPIGAITFDGPQTFTSPSGGQVRTVPANEIPLDGSFLDTRVALAANWQQPLGRLSAFNAGVSASKEYDYLHLGANFKLSRDFNNRNTTASLGLAFSSDELDPVGGAPMPLTPMLDVDDLSNRMGDQSKDIIDIVLGVSQIINRNLVVQLNYSYSSSDGYLNDPYKIVSLVDPVTGDPVPRIPTPGVEGPSHEYIFEGRPGERTKHSVYGQAKYYMNGKVLDASYRFMTDDWGIDSHTVDLRYRWPFGGQSYLEPHFRYYTQAHADFYRTSLDSSQALPLHASADYRLGEFDAFTVGLKYGRKLDSGNEWSARVELYSADGSVPADLLIGNQGDREIYPDTTAIIAQFSYSFGW